MIGAAAWYGYRYWTVGRFMVDTDDAYVQADFAVVAPKITGYVAAVPAVENQRGEGRRPAGRRSRTATIATRWRWPRRSSPAQQAAVTRIDSQAAAGRRRHRPGRAPGSRRRRPTLTQTAADLARYQRLASNDVASAQRLEAAQAADAAAQAAVREAEAGVATARGQPGGDHGAEGRGARR